MTSTVPVHQARRKLGAIIEEAHYLGKPFLIKRGNKPMAMIFGSNESARILELVERYDPGLADTLAIMADPELQATLEAGDRAIQRGEIVPFDESLLSD
jgi:hypothetical protein